MNSDYIEAMYESWEKDNSSVHVSWDAYFKTGGFARVDTEKRVPIIYHASGDGSNNDSVRLLNLIRAYQSRGYLKAKLDPLGIKEQENPKELSPIHHGFTANDLDRPLNVELSNQVVGMERYADKIKNNNMTLQEVVDMLEDIYCKEIGFQFSHVEDSTHRKWLRFEIERPPIERSKDELIQIVTNLAKSDRFENFLKIKFSDKKRFGLEGIDALIPGLKAMIDEGAQSGVEDFVFGMPHRGRLNVMANILNKPLENILLEFKEVVKIEDDWSQSGDVKYHLGASSNEKFGDKDVHLTLLPNPSHLEAVNTLVLGKSRCKLHIKGDATGHTVLPVILHGDAAFAGQGVVYETMQISRCGGYSTGGAIHVVCNNQIGFTTDPEMGRCTRHASDIGKAFDAPIIYVNADNLLEVERAFRIAMRYRQKFKSEVIIDLIGYRRYGHNEQDQPRTTQPLMYQAIDKHPPALQKAIAEFSSNGLLTAEELAAIVSTEEDKLRSSFERAQNGHEPPPPSWLSGKWKNIVSPGKETKSVKTGVAREDLELVSAALTRKPDNFTLERALQKVVNQKKATLDAQKGIDWGTAEALAVGTLLMDGIHCRLSGQDVQRGTFSHRHAVWHDQERGETFTPLNNISEDQNQFFSMVNSPLSEFGVLGFELGYSWETPNQLVMWEAQFGDFANGAQVIIDQFLSAGEAKWYRQSALVMLLPHGYQGMGPEHSSCRLERFLQCSDEDAQTIPPTHRQLQLCNWQVANPTTPANYFHLLRRQMYRQFRKPLIVASTKALLRHKLALSDFEDFTDGKFHRVIPEAYDDELDGDEDVNRVVFCSGKIYYELLEQRRKSEKRDVAVVRIEQLSPFPFDLVADTLKRYPNAEAVWSQEEPKNMGPWVYVSERITTAAKELAGRDIDPDYVGRKTMASPSEGQYKTHVQIQEGIINESLGI